MKGISKMKASFSNNKQNKKVKVGPKYVISETKGMQTSGLLHTLLARYAK